jgi:outer membrane protein assembly factor BamE (lipoprotein component of BamABCDE complex)
MDVRALQLLVDQQVRRIDALESALRLSRAGRSPPSTPAPPATKSADTGAWLQNANWDKLRPGMSEADVVRVLGPPTTTRKSENGNAQTLFYALELDAGGFLSGNVVIADQKLLEFHKPALK